MTVIFWISISFLVFIYLGYGLVIGVANRLFKTKTVEVASNYEWPEVAVLIAAYNEETVIADKIKNTLGLNYPAGKLKCYIVSDGSKDNTNEIVKGFENVTLFFEPKRAGKSAAINRAMPLIKEPVTIFTDANVMLNNDAILELAKHYADPKTGGVSGEKRVISSGSESAAATEGLYWKYESFLKNEDARFSSLVGAAGELFSIRTHLFEAIEEDTLLDDFMISMRIVEKGYRIAYEPNAYASETPSAGISEEYKRKVRISAGGLQSVLRLKGFLNPVKYGLFSLQYFFHRFSRWIISPVLIPMAFISNAFIAGNSTLLTIIFALQCLFHLAALAGYILETQNRRFKPFFVPYYFNFMHFCIIAGWFRYLSGKQAVTWQKATRLSLVNI
jgi:cellulose synthase/poly-beta-1,6-N-acetylglucosamine synthase-like glycosyltransferase